MTLDDDPRWRRLHDRDWTCAVCKRKHRGLFDLGSTEPQHWPEAEARQPNSAIESSDHILTEDFCKLRGEHYFVRCILELPIVGAPEKRFGYGVWSTLAKKNFDIYVASFDDGDQSGLGPWFGWFSNRLKGYPDTLNLKCQVHPRPDRGRPLIELESADHPLALEQRDGITLDRILEIYALNGHDIAPAFMIDRRRRKP